MKRRVRRPAPIPLRGARDPAIEPLLGVCWMCYRLRSCRTYFDSRTGSYRYECTECRRRLGVPDHVTASIKCVEGPFPAPNVGGVS